MSTSAGALEAIGRILDRGGDADDVLRSVLDALHERGAAFAAVRFVERGGLVPGPAVGTPTDALAVPVVYDGEQVGVLELATDDETLAERVATLISPYVLVGWDTGGTGWDP